MDAHGIIAWIVIGVIAGWLAGMLFIPDAVRGAQAKASLSLDPSSARR